MIKYSFSFSDYIKHFIITLIDKITANLITENLITSDIKSIVLLYMKFIVN